MVPVIRYLLWESAFQRIPLQHLDRFNPLRGQVLFYHFLNGDFFKEKNPIKIVDYILPPLMTRRSSVKIKEKIRDYETIDAGPTNLYAQRRRSKDRYSKLK